MSFVFLVILRTDVYKNIWPRQYQGRCIKSGHRRVLDIIFYVYFIDIFLNIFLGVFQNVLYEGGKKHELYK